MSFRVITITETSENTVLRRLAPLTTRDATGKCSSTKEAGFDARLSGKGRTRARDA
jgi:hypothetical protein